MTATETITSNARVLGADPLVEYVPAKDGGRDLRRHRRGGHCVSGAPLIFTVPEKVSRGWEACWKNMVLYEMNGIAFSDKNEIWWLETIGGHHWIARRVPDEAYVVMPNQFGNRCFRSGGMP